MHRTTASNLLSAHAPLKSSTASGAASPPPLHTIACISARTTSYHVAVLHSVHKNGLESQKTTARVPLCSHGLSRLAHLARSLPLLLLASARAALEVHLGHTEEVSCAHGDALGRPHRSRVHPHGMPSEGGNKAKSTEMMDQKAEEEAVGRGGAPELRISTVFGWMPKERSIALCAGSRAWPTCSTGHSHRFFCAPT